MKKYIIFDIDGTLNQTEKYRNLYEQPFPKIKESLLQLKKEGYKLAVCSNATEIHINAVKQLIG